MTALPFAAFGIVAGIYFWKLSGDISIYTDIGLQTANELQGFRGMLRDVQSIKVADIGDLIVWEKILPYSAAFGVSKRVIHKLQSTFGTDKIDTINQPIFNYYYVSVPDYNTSLIQTFDPSLNSSSPFYHDSLDSNTGGSGGFGGSSGGFSGGNAGGFGGGGGGGAF